MADLTGKRVGARNRVSELRESILSATEVEQVTLTEDLAYELPASVSPNRVHSVVFTQDGTGGHTVTYDGNPVTVDLAAGASTLVEVWPGGTLVYPGASAPAGAPSAITADDTPAAPAEGEGASYLVTSAVVWPAGLVWSTDPDGGVAPTITGTALVSMFTVGGVTRAVLAATFPAPLDMVAPVAGTLAASDITHLGFALTVTGASDNIALSGAPYAFSTDNGATYSAWQSSPTFTASGLTAETAYTCKHKVRDAQANETIGTAITATTAATPAPVGYEGAVMALSPAGYYKLDETTGTTVTDSSGNGRHGTYSGTVTLAAQDGFATFGSDGLATIPDADAFSAAGTGVTVAALVRSAAWNSGPNVAEKAGNGFEWRMSSPGADTGPGVKKMRAQVYASNGDDLVSSTNASTSTHTWGEWHLLIWSIPDPTTASTLMWVDGTASTFTFWGSVKTNATNTASPVKIGNAGLSIGHLAIIPGGINATQATALTDAARAEGLIA